VPTTTPECPPEASQSDERPVPPANRCLLHAPPRSGRPWRLADSGYRTCSDCLDRLREHLAEVADRWAVLDPRPGASYDERSRGAPGFSSRSPAADVVIAHRDWRSTRVAQVWRGADGKVHRESERPPLSVPTELYTLAHHVATARKMAGPGHLDVPTIAEWLDGQLDWVTRQEGVVAFDRVVRELVSQLRPLTGEPRARRVGECPNTIDEGEHTRECGRPLYAPLKGDTIVCRACGRKWPRPEWEDLGLLLQAKTLQPA
jgi:hypothetical protein